MFLPGDMLPTAGFLGFAWLLLAVTLADLDAGRCHGRAGLQKPPFIRFLQPLRRLASVSCSASCSRDPRSSCNRVFFFFLRFKSTSRANYLFSDLVFLCKGVRTRYEAAGPALASMSGPDGA